jgi:FkbM family methyltransferase
VAISRKGFLQGIACVAAGAGAGAIAQRQFASPAAGPTGQARGEESFSQSAEDRIAYFILGYLGTGRLDYLDVGAHDPIGGNNTYYFYRKGSRGVLIEPNAEMCRRLRDVRPEDKVLEAGIGVTAAREADYYVMTESSWNTFSKEEAERQAEVSKGKVAIEKVVKVPLLDINDVMARYLRGAPAFLSLDTQGLELDILRTIDFTRFRPKVICAETLVTGTREMSPVIASFLAEREYTVRGMTFVNTLFVDSRII